MINYSDVLTKLRKLNTLRVTEFGHGDVFGWSPTDWACAVAGETGEMCNLVKKLRRGDNPPIESIADEIGDIVVYLDLLSQRLELDLSKCVADKFNKKSDEIGSKVKFE